jgi:hypothetical protein
MKFLVLSHFVALLVILNVVGKVASECDYEEECVQPGLLSTMNSDHTSKSVESQPRFGTHVVYYF